MVPGYCYPAHNIRRGKFCSAIPAWSLTDVRPADPHDAHSQQYCPKFIEDVADTVLYCSASSQPLKSKARLTRLFSV